MHLIITKKDIENYEYGTVYDPEIHGEMTDEERHQRNLDIFFKATSKEDFRRYHLEDSVNATLYKIHMEAGETELAEPYREAYERDQAYEAERARQLKTMLWTEEEIRQRIRQAPIIERETYREFAKAMEEEGYTKWEAKASQKAIQQLEKILR